MLPSGRDRQIAIFDCREKSPKTRQRYAEDPKRVLSTVGNPWSLYHLMTSLPVSDAPSGRNRLTAINKLPDEQNQSLKIRVLMTNEKTQVTCERYTIDPKKCIEH
jgi:hypothetical protein